MDEFISYVLSFYGNGGIYDIGLTREMAANCAARITDLEGDSYDRETVRDLACELYGLTFI